MPLPDEDRLNPGHRRVRPILRYVGPVIALAGLILIVIGTADFFRTAGTFEGPRLFWCNVLGMPLLFVGVVITKFAFLGAILRYHVGETAPVAKDTFNYIAHETRGGVQTIAAALREGFSGDASHHIACGRCGKMNQPDAKFCQKCGTPLLTERVCAQCGNPNDVDARFCDRCGTELTD